jgi:integrase
MAVKIAEAVPMWVTYMKARGLGDGTINRRRYAIAGPRTGLLRTAQKLKGPMPTMGQLDQGVIDTYFVTHTGVASTRANKIDAVKSFLEWAENRNLLRAGFTAKKLLDGYKATRGQRKPKHYILPNDFPRLLASPAGPRDRAVIALALYTLARQSEIITLDFRHLDLDGKKIHLFRSKTKRWTVTGLTPALEEEMISWLRVYAEKTGYEDYRQMMADHPEWLVVPARHTFPDGWDLKPTQPTGRTYSIVKDALIKMGIPDVKGEGMHTIRRSGARALFKRFMDLQGYDSALTFVQAMLDHGDSKMTELYIGMDWIKEQLNEWILSNDMYGISTPAPQAPYPGNVVPFNLKKAG